MYIIYFFRVIFFHLIKAFLIHSHKINKIISDDLFLLMIQKSIICDADLEKMLIKVTMEFYLVLFLLYLEYIYFQDYLVIKFMD